MAASSVVRLIEADSQKLSLLDAIPFVVELDHTYETDHVYKRVYKCV